jgi:ACR3 family arsenite efflux pump ArsB
VHGRGGADRKVSSRHPGGAGEFEYANVSIPIAVLIWLMIYPMMMKVDFASVKTSAGTPPGCTSPGSSTG